MSGGRSSGGGGSKLSPQTLIVASLASLTAAILTSHFWRGGTPITAAVTPVIVAIASELYRRPAERISRISSRAAATTRARTGGTRVRERPDAWSRPDDGNGSGQSDLGPVRVYRPGPRRRLHLKLVAATAAAAFVIAMAVLTLPELVFGGSLASHGRTTFFGGGSSRHHTVTTETRTVQSSSSISKTSAATTTVTVPAQTQQTSTQTTATSTPAPPVGAGPTAP